MDRRADLDAIPELSCVFSLYAAGQINCKAKVAIVRHGPTDSL